MTHNPERVIICTSSHDKEIHSLAISAMQDSGFEVVLVEPCRTIVIEKIPDILPYVPVTLLNMSNPFGKRKKKGGHKKYGY